MKRRGYILIDCMVAVAIMGIGAATVSSAFNQYQAVAHRAYVAEGVARVLDLEMERARACRDARCVRALATRTATTTGVSDEANTWVRASVRRVVKPGPDGTLRVTIGAEHPALLHELEIEGLVWVGR